MKKLVIPVRYAQSIQQRRKPKKTFPHLPPMHTSTISVNLRERITTRIFIIICERHPGHCIAAILGGRVGPCWSPSCRSSDLAGVTLGDFPPSHYSLHPLSVSPSHDQPCRRSFKRRGGGGGPSCRRSWCTGPRKFILLIHPTPSGETGRKEQRDVMFRCCCPYTPKMIISDESLNLSVSFPCFFPFAYKEGHVDNRLDQNLFCSITPTVRPIPHPYITN